MSRRLARKIAFKVLYSLNYLDKKNIDELFNYIFQENNSFWLDGDNDSIINLKSFNIKERTFFMDLVKGTIANEVRINELIEHNLKSWSIKRIAKIDLAILQLAIYEIIYRDDVPNGVAINEAIELGKRYGTGDSGSFINGILGKVVRNIEYTNE